MYKSSVRRRQQHTNNEKIRTQTAVLTLPDAANSLDDALPVCRVEQEPPVALPLHVPSRSGVMLCFDAQPRAHHAMESHSGGAYNLEVEDTRRVLACLVHRHFLVEVVVDRCDWHALYHRQDNKKEHHTKTAAATAAAAATTTTETTKARASDDQSSDCASTNTATEHRSCCSGLAGRCQRAYASTARYCCWSKGGNHHVLSGCDDELHTAEPKVRGQQRCCAIDIHTRSIDLVVCKASAIRLAPTSQRCRRRTQNPSVQPQIQDPQH